MRAVDLIIIRTVIPLFIIVLVLSISAMGLLASVTRANKPVAVAGEEVTKINGGVIRHQMSGEGSRVVLFLHGFNQTLNMWDGVWTHLQDCPVRRLRIDIPGFGASRFDTDNYGMKAQAERLNSLLETLHIDKAIVVGGSMGGSLAVSLAAQYPERVEQLVLLAPSGYPGALRYNGLFGLLIKPGPVREAAIRLADTSVYKFLCPDSVALQATTVAASYGSSWLEQLQNTRPPAFIAWSRSDRTALADSALKVRDALKDGTLFWLNDNTGHGIPITRPAFVAEVACLTGQGTNAHDVAGKLSAAVLLPGDGGDTPAR